MSTTAYVIGLGRSGIAAARLLKLSGWEVILSDRNTSEALVARADSLQREGITVELGQMPTLAAPALPDLVVPSPGVPWDVPFLVAAREQGIDTIGEIELAWRYLRSSPWVAITGTNGKTTTTALLEAIFRTAALNAPACGNIGYAACEIAIETYSGSPPPDWVIAEISSYQIESSRELAPRIGIWTTLTPDHLSRHGTLERYSTIKASLLERSHWQILNGDDAFLHNLGCDRWPEAYWTSIQGREALLGPSDRGTYIEDGQVISLGASVMPIADFPMAGAHNQQNLLLAIAAARLAGVELEAIARAMSSFGGVPHRLEAIGTLDGIAFINDSKATNYDAAQVGLSSVAAPTILIAGGEAKDGDDTQWIETIRTKAAAVLLIGAAAEAFRDRLEACGYHNSEIAGTLEVAVPRAAEIARARGAKVVLLSPACASFDQYSSFEERGDRFRQLCRELGVSRG